MLLSKNIKKTISWIVKLAIVSFALYYIYKRIFENDEFETVIEKFKELIVGQNYFLFVVVCLLMLLNWSIESLKWRYLIRKIENISFLYSFKALLSGATFSIFTPYRIGEYGGRIFMLKKADRLDATLLTFIGNFSQLIITLIVGLTSSLYYFRVYTDWGSGLSNSLFVGLIVWIVFLIIVVTLVFLRARIISYFIYNLDFLGAYRKYGRAFSFLKSRELFIVLLLSFARYLVFSTQFYLLLKVFGADIPYFKIIVMINMTFLTMSILPSIAIAELGVRGSIAIYFIGQIIPNDLIIFTSTSFLWLINLVIPSLIGCYFLFNMRFFKKD